ncbi:MAG TPA: hypothetical protein VFN25_15550 [Dokdonella sp.]|nr:hypothetical protein [Dokdonella sp.]
MIKMTPRRWRVLTVVVVMVIVCLATMPEAVYFASMIDAIGVDVLIAFVSIQLTAILAIPLRPMLESFMKHQRRRFLPALRFLVRATPGIPRIIDICRFDGRYFLTHFEYRILSRNGTKGERALD